MNFDITQKVFMSELGNYLREKNIFCANNIHELTIGMCAFLLNDENVFKKKIYINVNRPDDIILENLDEKNETTLFINTYGLIEETDDYHGDKVLSYYLSNEMHDHISVAHTNAGDMIVVSMHSNTQLVKLIKNVITILPKIFTEIPITKNKASFIKDFKNIKIHNISELYIYALNQIPEVKEHVTKATLASALTNCIQRSQANRIQALEIDVGNLRQQVQAAMDRYEELLSSFNEKNDMLFYLTSKQTESYQEIVASLLDLFYNNPVISNLSILGNQIDYNVLTTLSYYDKEIFYAITDNKDADDIYILQDVIYSERKNTLALLKQIFSERRYKVRVAGQFRLIIDSDDSSVKNIIMSMNVDSYFPSPHGQLYNCVGTFPAQWNEAIKSGDIYNAILYTIAFTQNINFGDGIVTKTFVTKLMGSFYDKQVLEDENGDILSPREAIERIKNEQ